MVLGLLALGLGIALPVSAEDKLSIDELLTKPAPQKEAPPQPAPTAAPKKEGAVGIDSLLGTTETAPAEEPPAPATAEPAAEGEAAATTEGEEETAEATGGEETARPLVEESGTPIAGTEIIDETWGRVLAAFSNKEYARFTSELENLARTQRELGIRNLPTISNALLQLAVVARQRDSDIQMENRLISAAERLSPDYASPAFARAARLESNKAAFFPVWFESYKAALAELPVQLAAMAYLFLALALALLLLGSLFALALLYRHLKPLAHDIGHLLGVPPTIIHRGRIAVFILLLTPLVSGWGVLALAAFWVAVFFAYGSAAERRVAPVVLLALAVVPLLVQRADHYLAVSRSPLMRDILAAQHDRWDADLLQRLDGYVEEYPDSELPAYARALLLTKAREGERAREAWREVLKLNSSRWQALNNIAASWILEGNLEEAADALKEAQAAKGDAAAIHYNRALVYQGLGEKSKADSALQTARTISPSDVTLWEKPGSQAPLAERVVLLPLEESDVRPALFKMQAKKVSHGGAFSSALGFSNAVFPAGFCGAMLLIILILAVLRNRLHPASSCDRCGTPISATGQEAVQSRTTCSQCIAAFYRKRAVDADSKVKKIAQVERYQRRHRWLMRLVSVIPGAAHLGTGRSLTGILLALFSVLLASGALFLSRAPLLADSYLFTRIATWPIPLMVSPILVILLLASIIPNLKGKA